MSNGPFIKANVNDRLPGDEVKSVKGRLTNLNIEVFGAKQNKIHRIQILVNGRQDKALNFTRKSHPQLFTNEALQFKHIIPLKLDKDAHIIVVAAGEPAQSEGQNGKAFIPFAIANPIFIDYDGNGFVANKDTLGMPLPTAKKTAGEKKGVGEED